MMLTRSMINCLIWEATRNFSLILNQGNSFNSGVNSGKHTPILVSEFTKFYSRLSHTIYVSQGFYAAAAAADRL